MRTYGQTKDCRGCRYWSEMIAKCDNGGPVTAMCLAPEGPHEGNYKSGRMTCSAWKSGHYGAVDDPPNYGAETRPLYDAEDLAEIQ